MVRFFALLLILLSTQAKAVPMTLLFDRSQPEYYRMVFTRFLDWYEQETKNPIRARLSPDERSYVDYCLSHAMDWSYQSAPETYWNYLRVTLTQEHGKLRGARLAIGPAVWDEKVQALATRILRKHHFVLPAGKSLSDILWLEWDQDRGNFVVYLKGRLKEVGDEVPDEKDYYENILISYRKTAGGLEKKYYASNRKIPEDVRRKYIFYPMLMDVVDVVKDRKIQEQIFEVKSFDDRFMDDPIKTVANSILHTFRFLADSMVYVDHTHMQLYYP